MNILFISHRLYPCIIGGAEIFNYYLFKSLNKYFKIIILTLCGEEIGFDATVIKAELRKYGLIRISVPIQDLTAIIKLRKKIDLIHVTYMRDHWLKWLVYPIVKKIFKIPYIITIHGGGMHSWKPEFPHRLLFRNASEIIAVSQKMKNEYMKRTGRDVKYIPPIIPFEKCVVDKGLLRDEYGFTKTETILMFLGSIKKIKGCDTLVKAFINLGSDYIEKYQLRLLLAGDGNMRPELEAYIESRGFSRYIRLLGSVPHANIPGIIRLSDIFVLPSHFEGTPISMLEAMFNGMPIIGSDVNGINNIIQNERNGLLFEVNNEDDLKSKIVCLIENERMAEVLALQAKSDYKNRYNFDNTVEQYKNICENSGGSRKK